MPCTSKKYEAQLDKLLVDGLRPVDYVLTTRELGEMIRENGIDLTALKPEEADDLAAYSGAAVLYGASGGVMEAALRTAERLVTGQDLRVDFEEVRGVPGIKRAQVNIGGTELKVAVVNTLTRAKEVLEEIERDPTAYHYVEFMACPGGCIGGGGQPHPSSAKIVRQRREGLYRIDAAKPVRVAHRNPSAVAFLEYCHSQGEDRAKELLHTTYGTS
jgi:iron only hydrogenase large subunit-like protein